jgi:hypothetical protein
MNILHVYMLHGYTFIDIYEYHCKDIYIYIHEHILKFHTRKPYLARSYAGIYLCTYMHVCIYKHIYIYVYTCIYKHIYIFIYIHIYIYIYIYVYIYVYVCVYMYINIYIHSGIPYLS